MKRSTDNLRHTRWECKYHVVFIPKYRKKSIYGWVRKELGPIIRDLAQQKESVVEEGHLMADHVHMLLSIPPKYSVSGVVGFIKGKSAIAIARNFMDRAKNFVGLRVPPDSEHWISESYLAIDRRGRTCREDKMAKPRR